MADDLIERLKATEGHTPGPWRVRENRNHNPEECDLTICGDIFLLADVNGPNYSHCYPNAQLLALAPEMKARILFDAAEIDRLRAALAAAEAERDRAMRACEQIGERIPAPGSSGWAAMKERAAIAIWNRNDDEIDADAALAWARGDAEVALLAALTPARNEKED